jgi:hypothetical protein
MKLKNFQDIIQECLTQAEIEEIEKQAEIELQSLQEHSATTR